MHLLKISVVAAVALSSTAVTAKTDRTTQVVNTVQLCKAELNDQQIAAGMRAANWRDIIPTMGGRSMAAITGATQYRRGSDEVLVNSEKSVAGENCQFDFRKVSPKDEAAIVDKLDDLLGSHVKGSDGTLTWQRGSDSYAMIRRGGDLTILWLPATAQQG